MWTIGVTGCVTDEGNATVLVVIDQCTGERFCVRVALCGMRFEVMECLREAISAVKGRYDNSIAEGTKLQHDHGSPVISRTLRDDVETLGIESSPSFVC